MKISHKTFSRRQMLGRSAALLGSLGAHSAFRSLLADPANRGFKIGACDWSIGKMCRPDAMIVAKEIGLDGVQVSLGTAENGMHLRQPEVQARYRDACARTGMSVASLAIGELNNVPYKSDPQTVEWVADSIKVCAPLGCKVILLAFFGNGDLKGDKAGTAEVVRRLREVAPQAEKAGVILGVESWLSADEHMDILDRVGSPAVQVYYDVANSEKMGYDIYDEIRWLGKKGVICEFHAKENGYLLGGGRIDFVRVREAMDDIGYRGWIEIEAAVPKGADMLTSYRSNCAYLRRLFPPSPTG